MRSPYASEKMENVSTLSFISILSILLADRLDVVAAITYPSECWLRSYCYWFFYFDFPLLNLRKMKTNDFPCSVQTHIDYIWYIHCHWTFNMLVFYIQTHVHCTMRCNIYEWYWNTEQNKDFIKNSFNSLGGTLAMLLTCVFIYAYMCVHVYSISVNNKIHKFQQFDSIHAVSLHTHTNTWTALTFLVPVMYWTEPILILV